MKYLSALAWPPNPSHKSPYLQRWQWLRLEPFEGCIICLFPCSLLLSAPLGRATGAENMRGGACLPASSEVGNLPAHPGFPMSFLLRKHCREEVRRRDLTLICLVTGGERTPTGLLWLHHLPACRAWRL